MGVVERAVARERNVGVALKTLGNVSAAALCRSTQEVRALSDVSHPNLVALYELFNEEDQWFFTMELIDGVDLLTHVCGQSLDAGGEDSSRATFPARAAPGSLTRPTR